MNDILARIDDAIGCQQCSRPLDGSPSDDFCREECQRLWHYSRSECASPHMYPYEDDRWLDPVVRRWDGTEVLAECADPLRAYVDYSGLVRRSPVLPTQRAEDGYQPALLLSPVTAARSDRQREIQLGYRAFVVARRIHAESWSLTRPAGSEDWPSR